MSDSERTHQGQLAERMHGINDILDALNEGRFEDAAQLRLAVRAYTHSVADVLVDPPISDSQHVQKK